MATVKVFADSVKLSSGKTGPGGPGGPRGSCKGFSRSSRRRMIQRLASVRSAGLQAHFLTLTYPDASLGDEWPDWKRDVRAFRKRLMRRFPQVVGGVWRMEPQPRRSEVRDEYVPHFHLIVWAKAELPADFKAWARRAWYEVVGSEDPRHLRHGVDHKVLDSRRAIGAYVSKYVAKAQAGSGQEVGRSWGMFGELETDPYLEAEITASEYVLLRRLARRWLKSRKSKHGRRLRGAEVCTVFALGAESTPFLTVLRMLEAVTGDDYVALYASTEH